MIKDEFEQVGDIIGRREISIPLGIVVEKRKSKHPWGDWIWKPVDVIVGAGPVGQWVTLRQGEDWAWYHIGTLPLTLHRKETEPLILNLQHESPYLFVILRDSDEPDQPPIIAHHVTASSYEAQDHLDSGEEIVGKIPMPPVIYEWIRLFVAEHHQEEVFIKRRRDALQIEDHKFGKEPIFTSRPPKT